MVLKPVAVSGVFRIAEGRAKSVDERKAVRQENAKSAAVLGPLTARKEKTHFPKKNLKSTGYVPNRDASNQTNAGPKKNTHQSTEKLCREVRRRPKKEAKAQKKGDRGKGPVRNTQGGCEDHLHKKQNEEFWGNK